jgi:hypothetical protein
MSALRENPYRTLGLAANTSEKELQRQISIIRRYAEVGKNKSFDFDFPFLGQLDRHLDDISKAQNRIEQDRLRVHYALFWFLNINHVDETALGHLKEQNIDRAIEIWQKLLRSNSITVRNYSAAINLSTLGLGLTTLNGSFNSSKFTEHVHLKGHLINSQVLDNFIEEIVGGVKSITRENIWKDFVDEVILLAKPYLDVKNGISITDFINTFSVFSPEIRQLVVQKFVLSPISIIESSVERTKDSRTNNPKSALETGSELYIKVEANLFTLKSILGESNVQYQIILDRVATEILQCAVDYFVHYRDSDSLDPGPASLKLMKCAKSLGCKGQTLSRIEENISGVEEWNSNKEERDRLKKIEDSLIYITSRIEWFDRANKTTETALELVVSCKPHLQKIRNHLGYNDTLYLNISSAVVSKALSMLIDVVNSAQNIVIVNRMMLSHLPTIVDNALRVIEMVSDFDVTSQLRQHLNTNKRTLQSIQSEIGGGQSNSYHNSNSYSNQSTNSSYSSNNSSGSGGCYVATMVYGDYEHPQVVRLRIFRDRTLSKYLIGRLFIGIYYRVSPKFVEKYSSKKNVHAIIRSLIDNFIKVIT